MNPAALMSYICALTSAGRPIRVRTPGGPPAGISSLHPRSMDIYPSTNAVTAPSAPVAAAVKPNLNTPRAPVAGGHS